MLVHELIKRLEEFPPCTEVILDVSSQHTNFFMFTGLRNLFLAQINHENDDDEVLILTDTLDSELSETPTFENLN